MWKICVHGENHYSVALDVHFYYLWCCLTTMHGWCILHGGYMHEGFPQSKPGKVKICGICEGNILFWWHHLKPRKKQRFQHSFNSKISTTSRRQVPATNIHWIPCTAWEDKRSYVPLVLERVLTINYLVSSASLCGLVRVFVCQAVCLFSD